MQIFTYKDVSVCNVDHMFYDKRRVSTQISRLCHVHAQVHTLKDMSNHTFSLMEMWSSTVWHLVSYYFVWCEGTINVMFTLKTLLGCVYVQLLTYEDVSVCINLTWSPCMHTNVQLKKRARTHVFLTKTYLYPSFVIWDTSYVIQTWVCITYFPITLTEKNVSTQLLTYKAAFFEK